MGSMFRGPRLDPMIRCASLYENGLRRPSWESAGGGGAGGRHSHATAGRLRIDAKVLLFVETQYSHLGREIAELLVHNRLKYKVRLCEERFVGTQ